MNPPRPLPDRAFAILVLGDFRGDGSGEKARTDPPLLERGPVGVDRDDLDQVLASLEPSLLVPADDRRPPVRIELGRMEDFHPDRLVERVGVLRALLGGGDGPGSAPPAPPGAASAPGSPAADGESNRPGESDESGTPPGVGIDGLLDRILADTAGEPPSGSEPSGPRRGRSAGDPLGTTEDLREFVRRVTEPHLVRGPEEGEDARKVAVERAVADELRRLLHHPPFQDLEARWRALSFLVHGLDTGADLKVFLLRCTPAELSGVVDRGMLVRLLSRTSEEVLAGTPWSAVVLDREFSAEVRDLATLLGLAEAGAELGSSFLAGADPALLAVAAGLPSPGSPAPAEEAPSPGRDGAPSHGSVDPDTAGAWRRLRAHRGAAHLALLLPRFLLRLPYREGENPCEAFDFEELAAGEVPPPSRLLWGAPAFLAALVLGRMFRQRGWDLRPGSAVSVGGLPLALHPGPDGITALPSTEVVLDPGGAAALMEAGFTPLVGRPGEGTVRIPGLRSLSASGAALRGPWSRQGA